MSAEPPLLEVRDLRVEFRPPDAPPALALEGLSFSLAHGEGLAVLGESGSGKSAAVLAIAGLLPAGTLVSGSVRLDGQPLLGLPEPAMARLRGSAIGLVFQEPSAALDPVIPVGEQVAEAARAHGKSAKLARHNALDALGAAGIPDAEGRFAAYPHELSGGLRQRACIAMAIVNRPKLVLADEPTSALDVSVQAGIVELFAELRRAFGIALVVITHDLKLAARAADRALVLYAGRPAELSPVAELVSRPMHPYTRSLLAAAPALGGGRGRLTEIPGSVPAAGEALPGCRFAPRCPTAAPVCALKPPPMTEVLPGHLVACWRVGSGRESAALPAIRL